MEVLARATSRSWGLRRLRRQTADGSLNAIKLLYVTVRRARDAMRSELLCVIVCEPPTQNATVDQKDIVRLGEIRSAFNFIFAYW